MGIFKQQRPDEPDAIRDAAKAKIEAAERFTSALAAAGEAMTALFDADRAFLAAHRQKYGAEAHPASRLMNQFRTTLLLDLELNAPELLRYLNQPRQSRAKAQTVAALIARQVDNDLSSLPAEKEPAQ